jgi:poly-gamma-glutamate capsule biosynthesis protein CapA/YwtB (metallophosphatase superfamily)
VIPAEKVESASVSTGALDDDLLARLTRHVTLEEIPSDEDIWATADLEHAIAARGEPAVDLLVGGDIMLGGRAKRHVKTSGGAHPFAAVRPLLSRASVVLANLEGPLAAEAEQHDRRFSYRVAPWTARALAEAGVGIVTLANNHLMDCGREGVAETLEILASAGVRAIGAGANAAVAHEPATFETAFGTVGVLGYYWNRRCAATDHEPGGAMDDDASLARDIPALRRSVDFIVVTSHWGVPYERVPADAERARARRAIDLGADAVVAHHPHVVQPLEAYRGRPIFYSVGNFAFGSGNTKAEGLLVGFRRDGTRLSVEVHALYVKNRDPRVDYQPKVLRGCAARHVFAKLGPIDGVYMASSEQDLDDGRLVLSFPWSTAR